MQWLLYRGYVHKVSRLQKEQIEKDQELKKQSGKDFKPERREDYADVLIELDKDRIEDVYNILNAKDKKHNKKQKRKAK